MSNQRRQCSFSALFLALALCGCRSSGPTASIDVVPSQEAARIVNANSAKITGTLSASGSVDGYYTTPQGRRRNYNADGTLFYLAPRYFRFDVKSLGDRQFLMGSNDEFFWFYNRQDDAYFCGRQYSDEDIPEGIPVRPDQIIDALALAPLGSEGASDSKSRLQQRKEYWSDRDNPQIIRRVVFRDANGAVTMQSSLDRYKQLSPGGPLLPTSISAIWPGSRAQIRFRVDRWSLVNQVGPQSPQFATPAECSTSQRQGSRVVD